MILLYPKNVLDKEQLEELLKQWTDEDYIVLQRRDRALQIRGLNSYLQQEKPREDLTQLLDRPDKD